MSTTSVTLLDQLRHQPTPEAWQRFVDIYSPILLRYAISRGVHRDAADDLIQDVFVVLVEKLPTFEYAPGGGFRRWLFTILLNKWRDRKRVAARAPVTAGSHLPEPPADDDLRNLIGEAEYRQQVVSRAVALMQSEFEPTTWRACWEHGVLGRPAAEVAAELDVTENAVYLSTSRVLRQSCGVPRGLAPIDAPNPFFCKIADRFFAPPRTWGESRLLVPVLKITHGFPETLLRARTPMPVASCPPADVIGRYLDDRLTPADAAGLESHLLSCAACENRLRQAASRATRCCLLARYALKRDVVDTGGTPQPPARSLRRGRHERDGSPQDFTDDRCETRTPELAGLLRPAEKPRRDRPARRVPHSGKCSARAAPGVVVPGRRRPPGALVAVKAQWTPA